jgi:hypothetical protein
MVVAPTTMLRSRVPVVRSFGRWLCTRTPVFGAAAQKDPQLNKKQKTLICQALTAQFSRAITTCEGVHQVTPSFGVALPESV